MRRTGASPLTRALERNYALKELPHPQVVLA